MAKTFSWDEVVSDIEKKIPSQQFQAWVSPLVFVRLTDSALVVSAPTLFHKDWITENYAELFSGSVESLYGLKVTLDIEISGPQGNQNQNTHFQQDEAPQTVLTHQLDDSLSHKMSIQEDAPIEEDASRRTEPSTIVPIAIESGRIKTLGHPLDLKQTFDTFVVGASNQLAHAAARAVAEQPATQYNPLFIYSEAGLGKTHLLYAIGNHILKANPKARICYISAEVFMNDVIESMRHGKMQQFRQRYRDSYDVLLMDDVQFIAGKDRTQEEFFHTFNALHASRRQIVVTSDKSPKDIHGLEDRIRTRFEWGLIADIQSPEIETRIAILRAKAERSDIYLPNDVALFLASNIRKNIRELEGALLRLEAQASLTGAEISIELAKRELKTLVAEPIACITEDVILEATARYFGIRVLDLKGKERSQKIARARQIAMFLIRKYCDKSYPDIGILFGGKDHSTIMHGVRFISGEMDSNPEIRKFVEDIQNTL
ncbi:MAG: chromosomal replication initiator protein DnaA [Bacteriovoracia bacterium]